VVPSPTSRSRWECRSSPGIARSRPNALRGSRGPIVEEAALLSALEQRRIARAALDVFDIEPLPAEHPLRQASNTLLLPHLGYVTTQQYARFYTDAAEDILAWDDGVPVRLL
jgi:phosphoglycerate dehydrogenase-like enzyme